MIVAAQRAERNAIPPERVAQAIERALFARRPRARFWSARARGSGWSSAAARVVRDPLLLAALGPRAKPPRARGTRERCDARPPLFATLLPILGITFIDILGFSILIPILPYYVQHFGAPYVAVGLLFASFSLCQFVAGPIWGNLSDRIGRKSVLIVSQIGATIGWTLLAFAPTLAWVFVARIIEGFSGGNISVTQAYVADRVDPQQRSRAFAYVGAAFSAGLVLGPLAGGGLLSAYGYRMPFLLAAGLQVLTLLVTIFFLPERVAEKSETDKAGPSATSCAFSATNASRRFSCRNSPSRSDCTRGSLRSRSC